MMFIIRSDTGAPALAGVQVKTSRTTPEIVPNSAGKTDYFCVGKIEAIAALRAGGLDVIELRDGWYADDTGGGVGISGHGRYWEIRDTPLTVKEAVGSFDTPASAEANGEEQINVRKAIFGVK
jgi:hypothetical protein